MVMGIGPLSEAGYTDWTSGKTVIDVPTKGGTKKVAVSPYASLAKVAPGTEAEDIFFSQGAGYQPLVAGGAAPLALTGGAGAASNIAQVLRILGIAGTIGAGIGAVWDILNPSAGLIQYGQQGYPEVPGTDIQLGGPGMAEPSNVPIVAEWASPDGRFRYYRVQMPNGKTKTVGVYLATGKWWVIRPPRLAVIGKNMPRHQMITRLRRNLKRHTADAKTILQVTSPAYYAKMHGYRKYGRRR